MPGRARSRAFAAERLDEPLGARQPTAPLGHLTPQQQREAQPERTPDRALRLTEADTLEVGAPPCLRALVVAAREMGRERETFEIVDVHRSAATEQGVGFVRGLVPWLDRGHARHCRASGWPGSCASR
ncbi:hypothetical protein PA7_04350 [Pseudonocardia asaccharolytica DSM 44247 = NBRC 16224]|uniref:Uncharacterized protein n=1 Tax=Pseudonocardia asaccharolytica DSM 44247 = NBRC 16224 TaxID=1123024 RepID=A0A511D142_9PSEU|nr:hypothetical protein PA7_04350 [Pseudonocardia asaccharolytica DSM 44247 = NBRC 16224]